MISLAFKVPFNGGPFTNAGGFFLTAFLFYLGMAALGLATEFALEILTAKFVSFFLVCIIVANVAESSWPLEISGNHIYRVGAGLPFYNLSLALRTILFGTKNHIARTCGILLGWIGLSCVLSSLPSPGSLGLVCCVVETAADARPPVPPLPPRAGSSRSRCRRGSCAARMSRRSSTNARTARPTPPPRPRSASEGRRRRSMPRA